MDEEVCVLEGGVRAFIVIEFKSCHTLPNSCGLDTCRNSDMRLCQPTNTAGQYCDYVHSHTHTHTMKSTQILKKELE